MSGEPITLWNAIFNYPKSWTVTVHFAALCSIVKKGSKKILAPNLLLYSDSWVIFCSRMLWSIISNAFLISSNTVIDIYVVYIYFPITCTVNQCKRCVIRYLTPADCYTILLSIKWSSSLIQLLYFTASAGASDNQLFPLPLPTLFNWRFLCIFLSCAIQCPWFQRENRQTVYAPRVLD